MNVRELWEELQHEAEADWNYEKEDEARYHRRELRKQVIEERIQYYKNRNAGLPCIQRNDPRLHPGEYLGDTDPQNVGHLLGTLFNLWQDRSAAFDDVDYALRGDTCGYVCREWLVFADYGSDGKFLSMRLVPRVK